MPMMMLRGNESTAYAAKLARVKVIPAYPITPSTLFPEKVSELIANGEMEAEFLPVESEHSALSAAIGAAATGVRAMTATASQGLALMHEVLFIASGMRMPIVMAIGNRALSAPVNIWADQQDTIAERDSGWIQFYAETNQEALDLTLIAFKVAENENVLLPAMMGMDAFVLTHTMEPVNVPDQKDVDEYLGEKKINYPVLDPEKPATFGAFVFPEHYMDIRYSQYIAMEHAKSVIDDAFKEFEKKFGRRYSKVSGFMTDDAEVILVTMGSITGTARETVRKLRERGEKVGLVKITVYRPFPKEELVSITRNAKVVAVVDRNVSPGFGGAIFTELVASYNKEKRKPRILDFIMGLGGRDVKIENYEQVYDIAKKAKRGKFKEINWIDVDEEAVKEVEGSI
ncbi:MAG TPA: pyruvate ferredoxin oxidoreductase [Euryarchaeota archaeon]|jgi:pyruvate ferredoxin oxidoreductase alpha subunit|nr:MAG: pyruvate ferredoxin oxidoreductase [Aciduliprofundum sp.]HEU12692.1 pyruvate ferredoxin oxidoreductase [Euryarchaeota archaeon]